MGEYITNPYTSPNLANPWPVQANQMSVIVLNPIIYPFYHSLPPWADE